MLKDHSAASGLVLNFLPLNVLLLRVLYVYHHHYNHNHKSNVYGSVLAHSKNKKKGL